MPDTAGRSLFLPLLAPLALTGAFAVVGVLHAPLLVVLPTLTLMVAAWVGFALWVSRGEGASLERDVLATEQQKLMTELREFVGGEVGDARGELDRARALVRDAVGQLQRSCRSLEQQSQQQGALMSSLAGQDAAGAPDVRRVSHDAAALVGSLTQTLAATSHESVKTVQTIDRMAQHLDGIFELMSDLKVLADHTAQLATQAAAHATDAGDDLPRSMALVAGEVRHLAERSANFNLRIRSLVNDSKEIVGRVRLRVEETADREMNASIEARTRADKMTQQIATVNHALAAGLRGVTDCGAQIRDDVASAARSLQFEGTATQALAAATGHLERLVAINHDAERFQQTLTDLAATATSRLRALEEFGRRLREKRNS